MTTSPTAPRSTPPAGCRRPLAPGLACLLLSIAASAALGNPAPPTDPTDPPVQTTDSAGVQVQIAATVARAYLEDYLAWLGGHLGARKIRGASPALRARLAGEWVRPSRAHKPHGQIAELRTELTDRQHGHAVARVLHGDVVLHISLTLTRTGDGWQVGSAQA